MSSSCKEIGGTWPTASARYYGALDQVGDPDSSRDAEQEPDGDRPLRGNRFAESTQCCLRNGGSYQAALARTRRQRRRQCGYGLSRGRLVIECSFDIAAARQIVDEELIGEKEAKPQ